MKQTSQTVVMVSPDYFGFNPETAKSNAFQQQPSHSKTQVRCRAQTEFWQAVARLDNAGVNVIVLPSKPDTPDAVFPNNWFATDDQGQLFTFPLANQSRRAEVQVTSLRRKLCGAGFVVSKHSPVAANLARDHGGSLEGTGSLVFDHQQRIAYAALSERTDLGLATTFCQLISYRLVPFQTTHHSGNPIYHTNVMMSIGSKFAVYCPEVIEERYRPEVARSLHNNHQVISITLEQLEHFCGNILELENAFGQPVIVMSAQATKSFTHRQMIRLDSFGERVMLPLDTIETVGGGSARCMLAEIFLPKHG